MLTHKAEESTFSVCFGSRNQNAESLDSDIEMLRENKPHLSYHNV